MAENEWIYDANYNSWFYLDENGHYVENTWKDQYYLKSGGYMAKMNGFLIHHIIAGIT